MPSGTGLLSARPTDVRREAMPPKARPARSMVAAAGAIALVSAGSCSLLSGLRAAGGRCCRRSTDST
eukprot:11202595-Lingulodinium_polyedra.AAC.1